MAPDDSSGARPSPVVLRIKLRYDDLETMVARFAPNVGRLGLFLPTKSIQPIGAEVKFELRLATDAPAVIGLGRVKATRAPDPDNPRLPSGMSVELLRVTRDSRDVIMRMLDRRRELGLPDLALPMPSDVDSARRADSEPSIVRAAVDVASGPIVAAPVPPPALVPIPTPPTPPPGTVLAPLAGSSSGDSLLTAPRVLNASSRDYGVKPLAAEPTKRPRPRISELIARSTGSVAAQPSIDENAEVDVAGAVARARALATGDLDEQLDALSKDRSAAPIEISIEAASAELARQLGGSAVRRTARDDRARVVAPPDPVAEGTSERATVPSEPPRTPRISEPPFPKAADQSSDRIVIRTPDVPAKGHTQPLPRMRPARLSSISPLPDMPTPAPPESPSTEPLLAGADEDDDAHRAGEWESAAATTASTELPSALRELQARSKATAAAKVAELRRQHPRAETPNPPYLRASTEDIVGAVDALDDVPPAPAAAATATADPESLRTSSSSIDVAVDDAIDAAILRTPSPDDDGPLGASASPSLSAHEEMSIDSVQAVAEPITGSVIQLDELDMEDVEHTNIGDAPQSDLDDAEREAVADIQAALAADLDARGDARGDAPTARPADDFEIEEVSDFEILAEADASDADLLLADGERDADPADFGAQVDDHGSPSGYSQPLYLDESQSGYPSTGRSGSSYSHHPDDVEPEPPLRPSQDFASRLDLGDDDDDHAGHAADTEHSEPGAPDDNAGTQISGTPSAGYAPSAYDDRNSERHASYEDDEPLDFDRPSERYRYANRATNRPPAEEFDEPHAGFGQPRYDSSPSALDEPGGFGARAFDESHADAPGSGESSVDDLEATLSALHADLDDLSLPHANPIVPSPALRTPSGGFESVRSRTPSGPIDPPSVGPSSVPSTTTTRPEESPTGSGRVHRRASTEDGILIDFDDDE